MKRRIICLLFALILSISCFSMSAAAAPAAEEVSIMFTHDMHSHFDTEMIEVGGELIARGGLAKLKTAADLVRAEYPDSFLFDAGDFAMGTPFQTIFSTDAAELLMLGRLGFDTTTLGNHEFDYRTVGLTDMFHAAMDSGETLPQLFIANIDWERTFQDPDREANARDLADALAQYGAIEEFSYFTSNGVTLAVFGILGKEADEYAPESGLYFLDPIERSREIVDMIKAEGKADMIVCLSHSGTNPNPDKSEDELLAKAVPEIDLIISGHSHTQLDEPIIHGSTVVASCGAYTNYLGHVVFTRDGQRWAVKDYKLIALDASVADDPAVLEDIEEFREKISESYLSQFGYEYHQTLAVSPFAFTDVKDFGNVQGEDSLGNLISDSYIYAIKQAEGDAYKTVDVAVVPSGVVRGSFGEGAITVADAFNVSSLGIGPDRIPGYPLVSIYLTGAELKTVAEIDISVSTLMSPARLYMSGLAYSYNPNRLILNRVTDVWMDTPDGRQEIDDSKLYRVIGGLYSCQMLGAVEAQSFGLLSVVPKDSTGAPVVDFEQHIVYENGKEVKEWAALAGYLESFEQEDGVSVVPEYYNSLHGRKVLEDDSSIGALLKSPNKIAFILLGAVILILGLITLVVVVVVKLVKKARRKRAVKV